MFLNSLVWIPKGAKLDSSTSAVKSTSRTHCGVPLRPKRRPKPSTLRLPKAPSFCLPPGAHLNLDTKPTTDFKHSLQDPAPKSPFICTSGTLVSTDTFPPGT
jgi:hypothetical protein